jgi:hypothetical protein
MFVSCAKCDNLPKTKEEMRTLLQAGLCDSCESEARVRGWKQVDGIESALEKLSEKERTPPEISQEE